MKRNSPTHRKSVALIVSCAAMAIAVAGSVPVASSATLIQAGSNGQNVFTPSSVTVSKGSRVTWKFNGPHNVLGKGKGWHPGIKLRGTWSRTFRTAGKFSYRCTIHPGMNGKVIVR